VPLGRVNATSQGLKVCERLCRVSLLQKENKNHRTLEALTSVGERGLEALRGILPTREARLRGSTEKRVGEKGGSTEWINGGPASSLSDERGPRKKASCDGAR